MMHAGPRLIDYFIHLALRPRVTRYIVLSCSLLLRMNYSVLSLSSALPQMDLAVVRP